MAALISCPKCGTNTLRAGFPIWVWIVAIIFFPFGLLAFLVGRKPTVCVECHTSFVC